MDAIALRAVSKKFRKRTIRREYTTFKSELVNALLRRNRGDDGSQFIPVLKSIDLTIPAGRTVGIIGRNGSGKSTVLKLITGIYAPTSGTVEVNGRISALLELGAGFHPDFSGRENITINGIILGMSRAEIRKRTDAIIEFASLGDFIDEPVRTYSSGMYMRLAFAVATHVDPDILVIDEILAVGDEQFAKKSRAKMNEFKERGKTIVLVTHDLGTVESWCDMAAWIDRGEVRDVGDPRTVVAHYRRAVKEEEAEKDAAAATRAERQPRTGPPPIPGKRFGTYRVEISEARLTGEAGRAVDELRPTDGAQLSLAYQRFEPVGSIVFEAVLHKRDGAELFRTEWTAPADLPEKGAITLNLDQLSLGSGEYVIDVGIHDEDGAFYDFQRAAVAFTVKGDGKTGGILYVPHRWSVRSDERDTSSIEVGNKVIALKR